MKTPKAVKDTVLTTQLNDLLQLDHDAVQAYGLAIRQLESKTRKEQLRRYLGDHKRHITELKKLIRAHGGAPIPVSHLPTGPFKLAIQALGSAGDDRAVLLAFKSNERQVRDKYARAAGRANLPKEVGQVVRRAARDEERHYRWAEKTLQELGAGPRTKVGRVERVVEVANARAADLLEGAATPVMAAVEGVRRGARAAAKHPVKTAVAAAAAAGVAGAAVAITRGKLK